MAKANKQTLAERRDRLTQWGLKPWAPLGIGGIAALMTIIFALSKDWKLAVGVLIAGISLSCSLWFVQFYRKQLLFREKQREEGYIAAREAREAIVGIREATITQLEEELKHIKGSHQAVIRNMHRLIESTRVEAHKLCGKYNELSKARVSQRKELLSEARELGHLFLLEALEGLINIFRPLIPPIEGVPVMLWAAVRQHDPIRKTFVTTARHGEYTKARESSSDGIPVNRDIPKLVLDKYNQDGAGIIILSPTHESYDKKTMTNLRTI